MNNGLASLHKGWAIAHKFDWGWSYLGYGWFDWKTYPHLAGVQTCIFATRREAMKGIKEINYNKERGKFKIIRVIFSVVEERHLK